MKIFTSLSAAILAGFQVYDKTPDGYLVRIKKLDSQWAMALVVL